MPKDSKGKGGLGGKGKAKAGEKNPLFGTSTYAVMTAKKKLPGIQQPAKQAEKF
jgi:hypothetical protein